MADFVSQLHMQSIREQQVGISTDLAAEFHTWVGVMICVVGAMAMINIWQDSIMALPKPFKLDKQYDNFDWIRD